MSGCWPSSFMLLFLWLLPILHAAISLAASYPSCCYFFGCFLSFMLLFLWLLPILHAAISLAASYPSCCYFFGCFLSFMLLFLWLLPIKFWFPIGYGQMEWSGRSVRLKVVVSGCGRYLWAVHVGSRCGCWMSW